MKSLKKTAIIVLALSLSLMFLLSGCGNSEIAQNNTNIQTSTEAPKAEITVSAASSLKDAMNEIKELYAKDEPNVTVTFNFGSSGSLQQQIEQGASVDLFISAAAKQMDSLKEKGLIAEDTRKDLLGNRVVLVVPKDTAAVTEFKDLTGNKVKKVALGEPKSVPAGQYAEEVLTKLNIMDSVKPKVVYAKDVKEVLTWVETGNADAGVVYETDARVSEKVKIASVAPEDSHKPVVYPAAIIKASKNIDAAKEFMKYLSGEKAKAVFEKYGFVFLVK